MDDARVWEFEERLWTGDADHYRRCVSEHVLMALPAEPFLFDGAAAIAAVQDTPRWGEVAFTGRHVTRPEEGVIVIAYHARATRGGSAPYEAYCTSTIQRIAHEDWRVIQHSQTLALKAKAGVS